MFPTAWYFVRYNKRNATSLGCFQMIVSRLGDKAPKGDTIILATPEMLHLFNIDGYQRLDTLIINFIGSREFSSNIQVNLDMTDSMGPGKLVCHMQNPSYTYDEYLICIRQGPSITSVICKNPSYSGPSYPSSPISLMTVD